MKQNVKKTKLTITLAMLMIAVLCLVNVTYSYFSSTSNANGNTTLGFLDVKFVYREYTESGDEGRLQSKNENVLSLYSASGTIERETAFELSLEENGSPIAMLGIQNVTNSTYCYVRFWIDAYIADQDGNLNKSVNYGKYFVLEESVADEYVKATSINSSSATSNCYYLTDSLEPGDGIAIGIGNTLTLQDVSEQDTVPVTLLGEKLQIFISVQAVQDSNQAHLSVFDDEKGYYKTWK